MVAVVPVKSRQPRRAVLRSFAGRQGVCDGQCSSTGQRESLPRIVTIIAQDPSVRVRGKNPIPCVSGNKELLDDPRFHARNVYAIMMRILARFEFALGRRVAWGSAGHQKYTSLCTPSPKLTRSIRERTVASSSAISGSSRASPFSLVFPTTLSRTRPRTQFWTASGISSPLRQTRHICRRRRRTRQAHRGDRTDARAICDHEAAGRTAGQGRLRHPGQAGSQPGGGARCPRRRASPDHGYSRDRLLPANRPYFFRPFSLRY